MLVGARAEYEGLRIDPQFPRKFNRVKVLRQFRAALFEIEMQRDAKADEISVELDGNPLCGNLIPIQCPGSRHEIKASIPG